MLHRKAMLSCVFWLAIASVAVAEEVPAIDLTASDSMARKAEQNLLQLMQKKIKVDWIDAPLNEVLASIETQAELGVWVDIQALNEEGISTDQQITLNLGEANVGTALYFILSPLGLDWSSQTGMLEISTQAKLEEIYFTRTYDVAALCKALKPQLEALNWQPHPPATGGFGMGGGMGGGMFSIAEVENVATPSILAQFGGMGGMGGINVQPYFGRGWPLPQRSSQLELAVKQMLESCGLTWQDSHGDGGELSALPGRLVVRHNNQGHARVQSLLKSIEEVLVDGAKANMIVVTRPGYPVEEDAAIVDALTQLVTIDIQDRPLNEVLPEIVKPLGIRCWLDVQALQDEGVATGQLTSTRGTGITLSLALTHLLDPLGLTCVIREGALIVTTQPKADETFELRIYNCDDLSDNAKELIPTIEKCATGKWSFREGEGGETYALGSQILVINQTQRCHVEIACLLNDLRKHANPGKASTPPRLVQRVYLVQDQSAVMDLIRSLPELIEGWDSQRGSIQQLGRSLLIKQPAHVQDRIGDLIETLNAAYGFLKPTPGAAPATPPKTAVAPTPEAAPTAPVKPATTP